MQIRIAKSQREDKTAYVAVRAGEMTGFAAVRYDLSIVRIYVIVVLNIIFMIGRRDKERVKVNHFNAQILKVIQLIQNSLKIAAIEVTDIHVMRISLPVLLLL